MTKAATATFLSLLLSLAVTISADDATFQEGWPRWRGPQANGVSPHGDPPLHWSETENIGFKVAIPGLAWRRPSSGATGFSC
jgi:hypothetical protein